MKPPYSKKNDRRSDENRKDVRLLPGLDQFLRRRLLRLCVVNHVDNAFDSRIGDEFRHFDNHRATAIERT